MQALRRNFLLDHLVLEPVEASDPKLEEGDGVRALTFTGKDIYFKKDKQGELTWREGWISMGWMVDEWMGEWTAGRRELSAWKGEDRDNDR